MCNWKIVRSAILCAVCLVVVGCQSSTRPVIQPRQTSPAISPTDFRIVSYRGEWQGERFFVIGEVKNNGNIAAGVQLEAIARDKSGMLIDSVSFWPNSVSNIPPGGTTGVKYTVTHDTRATKMELKVIAVRVWR